MLRKFIFCTVAIASFAGFGVIAFEVGLRNGGEGGGYLGLSWLSPILYALPSENDRRIFAFVAYCGYGLIALILLCYVYCLIRDGGKGYPMHSNRE